MNVLDMNTINGAAHGEITLFPITSPACGEFQNGQPAGDELEPVAVEAGSHVLAHSESGHNHVMKQFDGSMATIQCFQMIEDPTTLFVTVDGGDALVEHMKAGKESHGSFRVGPGTYMGRISRESTRESPLGWQKATD